MITETHTHQHESGHWCSDPLGDVCRGEQISTGEVDIRIVGGMDWPGHDLDAIAVYSSDNQPLTPEDARLLAVRLVRLADTIDRAKGH